MSERDHHEVPPTPPPPSVGAAARQGFRQAYDDQKKDFLPGLGRAFVDDARWLVLEGFVAIILIAVVTLLGGLVGTATFGAAPGALIGAVVGVAVYGVLRFVVVGAALVTGIRSSRRR